MFPRTSHAPQPPKGRKPDLRPHYQTKLSTVTHVEQRRICNQPRCASSQFFCGSKHAHGMIGQPNFSDVNKDWTYKDKDKDQTYKDQDKDKD